MAMKRRNFLKGMAVGVAGAGVGMNLLGTPVFASAAATPSGVLAGGMHYLPKAKRVIYIFLSGGISQFESFEYKPMLEKYHDQTPLAHREPCGPACLKPLKEFQRHGESGIEVSGFFPEIASIIDEFTLIKSLQNYAPAHPAAQHFLFTGERLAGKPALGAWINYAIGTENSRLPGFINLGAGHENNKNGYLPSNLHGVYFATDGKAAVDYLDRPQGIDAMLQKQAIESIHELDMLAYEEYMDNASRDHGTVYELAYEMQTSIPEVMNLEEEPEYIQKLYGLDHEDTKEVGTNLLSARRLIEQGVRIVNVTDSSWDHHSGLDERFPKKSAGLDKPLKGLITDLKQRGMLDDTLVVVTGEFGRTPFNEGKVIGGTGRGHNPRAGCLLLAGGGIKKGFVYGETDDFGMHTIADPVNINDLNASILYALGIDHTRLTFELGGRNFKATGVGEARIVRELFA
jgi:hypothetical protein